MLMSFLGHRRPFWRQNIETRDEMIMFFETELFWACIELKHVRRLELKHRVQFLVLQHFFLYRMLFFHHNELIIRISIGTFRIFRFGEASALLVLLLFRIESVSTSLVSP